MVSGALLQAVCASLLVWAEAGQGSGSRVDFECPRCAAPQVLLCPPFCFLCRRVLEQSFRVAWRSAVRAGAAVPAG